jgi:hypothetical protein
MPADTHQQRERTDARAALDLLATVVGIDAAGAAAVALGDLELDDDLAILDLWAVVVEELGERPLGKLDLDLDSDRPANLGDVADLFDAAFQP